MFPQLASPYSLPNISQPRSSDVLASWLIQPHQVNSSGVLPGNTEISVNNGVVISGKTSSIALGNPATGNANITIDGIKQVISAGSAIVIDGANNVITITNSDGSKVGLGLIPKSIPAQYGLFITDPTGAIVMKIVGSTIYAYDLTQNPVTNVMQLLKLPNGTYGQAVAKTGYNVGDAIF